MPFKSEKQKTYLQINEPKIYNRWKKKYPVVKKTKGGKLSKRKKTK